MFVYPMVGKVFKKRNYIKEFVFALVHMVQLVGAFSNGTYRGCRFNPS